MPTFTADVFSPRWGRDDKYTFAFEQNELTITQGVKKVTATYNEKTDPTWTGHGLHRMLRDDSIAAPEAFQPMIEYLWLQWRDRAMSNEAVDSELQAAVEWLNTVTTSKPRTDFCRGYF